MEFHGGHPCKKDKPDMDVKVEERNLTNTNMADVRENVSDIKVFGDGDMFKLLCKASSKAQGFMKSTKACEIEGVGCIVQSSTERIDSKGRISVAEASVFVPGVEIFSEKDSNGNVIGRRLEAISSKGDL